ncbi:MULTISPECIES: aminotransferase class V-fold PLP-dependent enzyme [Geobacter]|uniref:cysteine desulfurase n=2 Tax=Geobacter TaxID=28231 RepID=A0A0C1QN97_9BACT|nr:MULTISPECIES: aminotransferase class V-fold PLP-dependent enzyme [Geobacter]ANA40185.1 cysteine desulfurase [Geobacter anodireducens]KIE42087.1 cysteine desulfurase [Geobacter soli]MBE2886657.1 aminotransferase class V-fold PLP-dependent enzyme [Geobacter anodireducens]
MSVYLDNAATSFPKPEAVYEAVDHALRRMGVGPGRGGYRRSIEATRIVFEAREAVAALLGVTDSSRVVFTHSATEALNLAVSGLLSPGDHVVTTTMEHNSLVRPLHVAAGRGVEVTRVPADRRGFVTPKAVAAAMRPNTRLVALSHCSNVTGALQPVEEIGAEVKKRGALLLVDAAQSAGMIPLDAPAIGIDLLAAPGHKGLLGPQGTGILYVAEGTELTPLMVGGTGIHSSDEEQPDAMPERYESGTLNTPGIAGLGAGVAFIARTGLSAIREREASLVRQILEGLAGMRRVTVHGPAADEPRGSVISFSAADMDPQSIGFRLDRDHDISVRVGLHCAPSAHRTIGTYPAGTVRVSPGFFTTDNDVEFFLRALCEIVGGRGR